MATYTFDSRQFAEPVFVQIVADGEIREVQSYCAQDNPNDLPRESVFVGGYGWLGLTDVITPKHAVVVDGELPSREEVARRIAIKLGKEG